MDKTGFVMVLLGLGGMAEAYPNPKQIAISAVLIIVGAAIFYKGSCKREKNTDKRTSDSNVFDRLHFLGK